MTVSYLRENKKFLKAQRTRMIRSFYYLSKQGVFFATAKSQIFQNKNMKKNTIKVILLQLLQSFQIWNYRILCLNLQLYINRYFILICRSSKTSKLSRAIFCVCSFQYCFITKLSLLLYWCAMLGHYTYIKNICYIKIKAIENFLLKITSNTILISLGIRK